METEQEHIEPTGVDKNSLPEFNTDLLKIYYSRLFPYQQFYDWLSYTHDPIDKELEEKGVTDPAFCRREFSFTLENDIYLRYLSFNDAEGLKKEMVSRLPIKMDLGAIYNLPPRSRQTVQSSVFEPIERELIFDIDLTDYDEVRTCCKEGNICLKCWKFCVVAVHILERILKEEFGFKHILCIYSGRRGIHMWVCDKRARQLTDRERKCILNYISITIQTNKQMENEDSLPFPPTPSIVQSFNLCEQYFTNDFLSVSNMALFDSFSLPDTGKQRLDTIMKLIDSNCLSFQERDGILSMLKETGINGKEKWLRLKSLLMSIDLSNKTKRLDPKAIHKYMSAYYILFYYVYPRIDTNVSVARNHLLKSMFCIHPKTGKVCIPIAIDQIDTFNPLTVPTLSSLIQELDNYNGDPSIDDLHKTSLGQYVDLFETEFIQHL
ncbi:hypothetical protein WA158_003077 [Blastocystis sp. Blastoise]